MQHTFHVHAMPNVIYDHSKSLQTDKRKKKSQPMRYLPWNAMPESYKISAGQRCAKLYSRTFTMWRGMQNVRKNIRFQD